MKKNKIQEFAKKMVAFVKNHGKQGADNAKNLAEYLDQFPPLEKEITWNLVGPCQGHDAETVKVIEAEDKEKPYYLNVEEGDEVELLEDVMFINKTQPIVPKGTIGVVIGFREFGVQVKFPIEGSFTERIQMFDRRESKLIKKLENENT